MYYVYYIRLSLKVKLQIQFWKMEIAQYRIFKAQATFFNVIYRFVKIGDNYIITDEVQ